MLQIKDIYKKYVTGDLVQTALDGVSLNLRNNEFVAILGPSGSGKTTMLNVIGGLDRYDSGDLIINGISTKKYNDRDWDSYRNHTIGFVFQSYNLIPHQTVLANVELALTISGISPSERRKRATKALEDVGLGNQLHKKPNQMSGGQMQRVAIARALVNNPDILLADEPTGALDSETSVQVMELLKEVSHDRLVVMVTHNPELAEEYANRIVRVKDGRIIGDSNPYLIDADALEPPKHKNMGRASMSFFTALALSFNNLRTKLARTLLTSFAGSIGIIGIALIMSLSTGFQLYIDKIQEDTLSNYPLVLQQEAMDMSSMLGAFVSAVTTGSDEDSGIVTEQPMISHMFSQVGTNDLASFKVHLDEHIGEVAHTINAIRYSYGIKPQIYTADTDNIFQVNPASLFGDVTGSSAMSSYMDSDIFYEMLDNVELLSTQYDVLLGRWPEAYNELLFVLSDPVHLPDYTAYSLGLKDTSKLKSLISDIMEGKDVVPVDEPESWTYEELLSLEFRLVNASSLYRYNSEYEVWEKMTEDKDYMSELIRQGEPLKIVGIVTAKEDVSSTVLQGGIAYTKDLTLHVMEAAQSTPIVINQLTNPSVNVFTGKRFDEENEAAPLDFNDMITVDGEMLSSAFGMNLNSATVISMMRRYMNEAMEELMDSTAPAQQVFISTFKAMGSTMLKDHIQANTDPVTGKATIYLADAQSIVDVYMASDDAAAKIQALVDTYGVEESAFRRVFEPLLLGLVNNYVASQIAGSAPETPQEPTEPEVSEPTDPDETTPEDETGPTEPDTETTPTVPDDQPPVQTDPPQPTDPQDPLSPPESSDPPTQTDPPESPPVSAPDSPPDAGASGNSGEVVLTTHTAEPVVVFLSDVMPDPVDPPLDTGDSSDAEDGPAAEMPQVYAEVTMDSVDPYVEVYSRTTVVTGAGAAMSAQMMQGEIRQTLTAKVSEFGRVLMGYVGSAFHVDADKITGAFQFNMTEEELSRLMEAMNGRSTGTSKEANLRTLGYANENEPTAISIYMIDFAGKEEFIEFLDAYNADMEEQGLEDKVISYTDITGIMMSSVRTIIDSVSYVLIAFVSVSLVVSSIMIGIITYISVMERTKEIGVLRAIGASKGNISQVFNAETFIIGLCSGIIGVGVTFLANFPINYIIHDLTGNPDINAQLPIYNAVILVLLSMILTVIGGLIPSRKAAKKDPVIALRSE